VKTKLEEAEWFAWNYGTDPGVVVVAIREAVREARAESIQVCIDALDAMTSEYAGHEQKGGEKFNAATVLSAACWRLTQLKARP
jgi:hypothetical protein